MVRVSPGSPSQWIATWSPRPASTCRSRQLYATLSCAADEPLRERRVRPVEHLVPLLGPVPAGRPARSQKPSRSALGLGVRVGGDVGVRGELGRRRELARLVQQVCQRLAHAARLPRCVADRGSSRPHAESAPAVTRRQTVHRRVSRAWRPWRSRRTRRAAVAARSTGRGVAGRGSDGCRAAAPRRLASVAGVTTDPLAPLLALADIAAAVEQARDAGRPGAAAPRAAPARRPGRRRGQPALRGGQRGPRGGRARA